MTGGETEAPGAASFHPFILHVISSHFHHVGSSCLSVFQVLLALRTRHCCHLRVGVQATQGSLLEGDFPTSCGSWEGCRGAPTNGNLWGLGA